MICADYSGDLDRKSVSHETDDTGVQYEVLVRLAKSKSWVSGDSEATLREVTEAAAHTMGIERVNVWLFAEERTKMRCIEHYERSKREHTSSGAELAAADYPIYFQALNEERAIVAHDARVDSRTREFASAVRFPGAPAASSHAPIDAAWPIQVVCTSDRMNCIVS